jgi:hypothetical protein
MKRTKDQVFSPDFDDVPGLHPLRPLAGLEHANCDSRGFVEMTFEKDLIGRYAHAEGWRQPPKSCCFVAANYSSPQWTGASDSNALKIVVVDQNPAPIRLDC